MYAPQTWNTIEDADRTMTVEITLDEYRELVKSEAQASERIQRLKDEVARLKEEKMLLKEKIVSIAGAEDGEQ